MTKMRWTHEWLPCRVDTGGTLPRTCGAGTVPRKPLLERKVAGVDVTIVGTGAMGAPIAENLLKAGFEVGVWNRNPARSEAVAGLGAIAAPGPDEGFGSPVVLSVLADDAAVREVFLDSPALEVMNQGSVHVNLATISPSLASEAAGRHTGAGVGYVAAPMFGGVPVAQAGRLNIVTAGQTEVVERVRPYLDAFSAALWPVGEDPAQANVLKVAGQILIASAIQAMSEAVSVVERSGGDVNRAVEVFTSTITPGPVYSMYGAMIAESRYEPARFTPILGRKDVDLARSQAAAEGLRLPFGDLLSGLLREALAAGHESRDWAVLGEMQRHRNGGEGA